MQNSNTKTGKIIDIVNENGVSKTVIEFEDFESLEKGIRNMLAFAGYEDCSFYIHQHVNRSKYKSAPHRANGAVDGIFKNGFSYSSYNNIGQTVCRMGIGDLCVGGGYGCDYEKQKKVNQERDVIKQNGTLLDVLTFDAINYDYEGYMSDENCVTIMAMPRRIDIGEKKTAPFGCDITDNVSSYDEVAKIPYCELTENNFLGKRLAQQYVDETKQFAEVFGEKVAQVFGLTLSDIQKMTIKELLKHDTNGFFKENKELSNEIINEAFKKSYLKDGEKEIWFEDSFKNMFSYWLYYDIKNSIDKLYDKTLIDEVESLQSISLSRQESRANLNRNFILGNIAFGSEEYGFTPTIQINNNFFAFMNDKKRENFFDMYKDGMIEFANLNPTSDSQEDIDRKVKNKTIESYKDKTGAFREGSYLSDFDFD